MHFLSGLSFNFCWLLSPYSRRHIRITTLRLVLRSSLFLFRSPALGAHYYRFLSRSTRSFFVRNTLRSRCSKLFFALRCFERNHSLLLRLCSRFAWFLHIDKNISGKNSDAMAVIPCTLEGVRFSCRIVRMLTQQARARKHSLGQEVFLVYEKLLRRHTFDLFLAIVFFFYCLLARLKISRISKPLILLSQLYDFYNANNYSSDCFRPVTRANDYRSNKGFIHCE